MDRNTFSLDEVKQINSIIQHLYNENLSPKEIMDNFMDGLRELIYFDKRDFTFFRYNTDYDLYEIHSFYPANWKDSEKQHYIDNYIHMDDVLPILSKRHEIAFRNDDFFSEKRKDTKYYQEFVQTAQLEISIDANIPLPESYDIFIIFALYRDSCHKAFSSKELEIVKLFQRHLSKVFEKQLSKNEDIKDGLFAFDSFESFGICILSENFELLSHNTFFKNFISVDSATLDTGKFDQIKKAAIELSKTPALSKLNPVYIDINDDTYLLEVSRYHQSSSRYLCAIYPLSQFVSDKIYTLKDTYKLSDREFEILILIIKNGMTNEEIANHLYISPATVKRHIANAYLKLGINNQK